MIMMAYLSVVSHHFLINFFTKINFHTKYPNHLQVIQIAGHIYQQ